MSTENNTISTAIEDHVKPADVEKAELAQAAAPGKGMSVEESASMLFELYFPKFSGLVETLSNKSLKRLIIALVAVPLEDARLNLNNEKEKMTYAIAEQLLVSKSALILSTAYEHEQKLKAEQEAKLEETKTEENKGEVTNG